MSRSRDCSRFRLASWEACRCAGCCRNSEGGECLAEAAHGPQQGPADTGPLVLDTSASLPASASRYCFGLRRLTCCRTLRTSQSPRLCLSCACPLTCCVLLCRTPDRQHRRSARPIAAAPGAPATGPRQLGRGSPWCRLRRRCPPLRVLVQGPRLLSRAGGASGAPAVCHPRLWGHRGLGRGGQPSEGG